MVSEELLNYVKECRIKNISDKEIIENLSSHGWPIDKINEVLNLNQQVAQENSVNQKINFSIPTQSKNKDNKLSFKIIIFLILTLIGVITISIFLVNSTFKSTQLVNLPTSLPSGYKTEGKVEISSLSNVNRRFVQQYQDTNNHVFLFVEDENTEVICKNTVSNIFVDYKEFKPGGSSLGCAVTLIKLALKTKDRSYTWQVNNDKFYIISKGLSITDEDAMNIANSVKPTQSEVVKVQNSSNF